MAERHPPDDKFDAPTAAEPAVTRSRPPPARPPEPNSIVGHYEILQPLGKGGMGDVFLARDLRLGRRVALKFLRQIDPQHSARFFVEARATAQIAHENIVALYDIAEHQGLPYMVLEYVPGKTLDAWIREHRNRHGSQGIAPIRVAELMLPVARALQCAHAAGIVHRDLKPENIMLTESGTVKVLDFGVAKLMGDVDSETPMVPPRAWAEDVIAMADLTQTGTIVGTRAYMAPEQWCGEPVDGRTDIWAVGIILYQLVTGDHPLVPLTPESVVTAANRELPMPSVLERLPNIGPLGLVIDRCLLKHVGDRLQSAAELCAALEEIAHPETSARLLLLGDGDEANPLARTSVAPPRGPHASVHPINAPPTVHTVAPPFSRSKMGLALAIIGLAIVGLIWVLRGNRSSPVVVGAAPSASASASTCSSNAECRQRNGGPPAICRRDRAECVPLVNDQCHVLAEPNDIENDETIWFGAMYPFRSGSQYGKEAVTAVDLARRDFATMTGGVPSTSVTGKPRPIGVVMCDDTDAAQRAVEHLVGAVGVPVVLGFARSKEVLDLANTYFLPRGVLALASNTASMLVDIPHAPDEPRLVLRVTTSADMVSPPKAAVVEAALEPLIRSRGLVRPNERIRLALVRVDNASGVSHSDKLFSILRWNGQSATENGSLLQQFVIPDRLGGKDRNAKLTEVAKEIGAFGPQIIIEAGADAELFLFIERMWPEKWKYRPHYVTPTQFIDPDLTKLVDEHPDAARRLFTVDVVMSLPRRKFVAHHNEIFAEKMAPDDPTSAPYDAFYVAAYALIALGDEPVTGKSLARAVRRLVPPGEPIDVGPGGIYSAIKFLRAGKNIDLVGTQTSLDFNPETGDAPADFTVLCLDAQRVTRESGLVFRAQAGKLEGKMNCF